MRESFCQVDRNFVVPGQINTSGLVFYRIPQKPFRLYGLQFDGTMFRRMPENEARQVSEKVLRVHTHTAGGRLRFMTDSSRVAIRVCCEAVRMPHFPLTATGGFDLYCGLQHCGTFIPPGDFQKNYESVVYLEPAGERLLTIHFPLYAQVFSLEIGLEEGAVIREAADYQIEKPIVFYGSSITQGAAASRPGMNYENILSRRLDCNHINLGFSGSARGELAMAEYISNLEMSAFVMDYDHNSSVEELRLNHCSFYETVRAAKPLVPILILPRPRYYQNYETLVREKIIRKTYEIATGRGDLVYFIAGPELMSLAGNDGTVDQIHPNDWGYASMASAIENTLNQPQFGRILY